MASAEAVATAANEAEEAANLAESEDDDNEGDAVENDDGAVFFVYDFVRVIDW